MLNDVISKAGAGLLVLFAIVGGAVVSQVSPTAAAWFCVGCLFGSAGTTFLPRIMNGWVPGTVVVLAVLAMAVCWRIAWVEYNKPEQPNFAVEFVPEPAARARMSAHIDVTNLGKEDWLIVFKRYSVPNGFAVASDIQKQTAIHGRPIRVSIPMSPDFIELVVKKTGRFNFELSVVPARAPRSTPRRLVYPLEFSDNALASSVKPTTGVEVQEGMNADAQGDADLMKMLAQPKGVIVRIMPEKYADGSENRGCFRTPHNGAWVYSPSKRVFAFTVTQKGLRRTMVADFKAAPEHKIIVGWDQYEGWMSLSVDGVQAQRKFQVDGRDPWELTCPY